eukprot:TRINITY_DN7307_c0_g1_i19.p1 TRINITY_DN7307_c0_g1~~TRINITY_DN7307_c0_g1_i19.p1  ORF type:complete len:161 (-),score=20.58 TRINITY_DN7307_c0_g1_i19:62-544(-)
MKSGVTVLLCILAFNLAAGKKLRMDNDSGFSLGDGAGYMKTKKTILDRGINCQLYVLLNSETPTADPTTALRYKIGITHRPIERRVETPVCKQFETLIHTLLARYNEPLPSGSGRTEWFRVPLSLIDQAIARATADLSGLHNPGEYRLIDTPKCICKGGR